MSNYANNSKATEIMLGSQKNNALEASRVPMTAAEFNLCIARDILCMRKAVAFLSPVFSISRFPRSFMDAFAPIRAGVTHEGRGW
jgi:hypothetical protein